VPAATADAVRVHPIVRQAMEIFDATSIRVRARADAPSLAPPQDASHDDAEPAALIDAPAVPEGDR
jgi:hypothetical protein